MREPVDIKRDLKFANVEVERVYCVQEEHEQLSAELAETQVKSAVRRE